MEANGEGAAELLLEGGLLGTSAELAAKAFRGSTDGLLGASGELEVAGGFELAAAEGLDQGGGLPALAGVAGARLKANAPPELAGLALEPAGGTGLVAPRFKALLALWLRLAAAWLSEFPAALARPRPCC